jgi:capsular exopolysaccharide synthesis family protein
MSRIFDALQRSGAERSGVEYSDMVAVATEVFEVQEKAPTAQSAVSLLDTPVPAPQPQRDMGAASESELTAPSDILSTFATVSPNIRPTSRLVFFGEPNSLAAEKFRFLAVRLRQLQQSRPLKKILITSTIPQEGKSTVAANLACTLARTRGQKTILIDGDLRRPTVASVFGVSSLPGISEWLQGKSELATSIHQIEGTRLCILPAGALPSNPLELMQSGKLSALMQTLSDWFDWIVIDSPPILPLADTSIWMRLADGFLLVARQGFTERDVLKRGVEAIEPSKMLGTIMNGSTTTHHSDYYYQPKS